MSNEKTMIIISMVGLIKTMNVSECFPKLYEPLVETLKLIYLIIQSRLKKESGYDATNVSSKTDLASLKAEVD